MAEKVLPAINKDRLHNGKVQINRSDLEGVDLKALLEAVRSSKDGEYVTVQSDDNDVRVAKQAGYMVVHVTEKGFKSGKSDKDKADKSDKSADKSDKSYERSRVDVKVPMKVVEALLSAGKDELDVLAALRALSAHGGDTELVTVKSDDSTVRVWLDSKNVSD
jgi:stalled ribosome rescue protein Dom34